ncbi:MTRF1L release factor glutamine methyltransferase [Varanus komodoensis]|nr:MTRF1L release factor glutamine methyltransferase [Varanus komodoensis]
MKPFRGSLYKKLLCLLQHCGHFGLSPAKGPCHRLRQYSCYKAGLVTATDLVSYWQDVFEANAIPEPQTSAEYIVAQVLGAKTFQSLSTSCISTPLLAKQQDQVQELCAKRLQRMPVQYVLGEWDFQDLTLKMKAPVFIPRPETEASNQNGKALAVLRSCFIAELVSLTVAEELRKRVTTACCKNPLLSPEPHGPVILEVGCGSGAIALSLLKKLPHSQVIAIDKSEAAVNLTKENAERCEWGASVLNLVLSLSLSHTGHWKFNMAPHGKELSEDLKKRIVALHKDGLGYKKTAKTLKLSCSTVAKTIQRFNRTGSTQNRPRHGRPKKLSACAQSHIQRLALGNRRMSAASIAAEVEGVVGQPIHRTLHQIGLQGCHPKRKPLLKMMHKKAHKQFAEDKQTKDMD